MKDSESVTLDKLSGFLKFAQELSEISMKINFIHNNLFYFSLRFLTFILSGIGVASAIMLIWRNAYYILVSVWAAYYAFHIFYHPLPWKYCSNWYNSKDCRTFDQFYLCVWRNQTLDYIYNQTGQRYSGINNLSVEVSALLKNITICEEVRSPTEEFFQ